MKSFLGVTLLSVLVNLDEGCWEGVVWWDGCQLWLGGLVRWNVLAVAFVERVVEVEVSVAFDAVVVVAELVERVVVSVVLAVVVAPVVVERPVGWELALR